jgi:ribosomal protein S27E
MPCGNTIAWYARSDMNEVRHSMCGDVVSSVFVRGIALKSGVCAVVVPCVGCAGFALKSVGGKMTADAGKFEAVRRTIADQVVSDATELQWASKAKHVDAEKKLLATWQAAPFSTQLVCLFLG